MVNQKTQVEKAERFRAQHLDEKLLILPNIWDALGAKLIQQVGFQSVATAERLKKYDSSAFFARDLLPREYLNQLV
jgi:hypothetical protein